MVFDARALNIVAVVPFLGYLLVKIKRGSTMEAIGRV